MLESTVELLGGLFWSSLTLLIGSCIVGSIVAAVRAVGRGGATVRTGGGGGLRFVVEMNVDDGARDIAYRRQTSEEVHYG
jgi:hypothetical protein